MQQPSESSRKDSLEHSHGQKSTDPQSVFVEVALPLHVRSTFYYRIPPSFDRLAQKGSRIVVPLGKKLVTGYIVAVRDKLPEGISLQEAELKDAKEILDAVPLVTPELLELTEWVADYYMAPWGEVIKASLPPGISPVMESFISITDEGRSELERLKIADDDSPAHKLLEQLVDKEEIKLADLLADLDEKSSRFPTSRLARQMERNGFVEIMDRAAGEFVKTKYQRRVRLSYGRRSTQ